MSLPYRWSCLEHKTDISLPYCPSCLEGNIAAKPPKS